MKSLPLKLTIGILTVFGLLILGFVLYEPMWWKVQKYRLCSDDAETYKAAIVALADRDKRSVQYLERWCRSENGEFALRACITYEYLKPTSQNKISCGLQYFNSILSKNNKMHQSFQSSIDNEIVVIHVVASQFALCTPSDIKEFYGYDIYYRSGANSYVLYANPIDKKHGSISSYTDQSGNIRTRANIDSIQYKSGGSSWQLAEKNIEMPCKIEGDSAW